MDFTKAWVGYDLPYETIEKHPAVQAFRSQGIEKRIKAPEYHVTAGFFDTVSLEALTALLSAAEAERGASFAEDTLVFDGYGTIESSLGTYVYFSPKDGGAQAAAELKKRLQASPLYDAAKNCRDLHLSIGGPDPFSEDKPKMQPLVPPFELKGRLVFVGYDGRNFRRFIWSATTKTFVEERKNTVSAPVVRPALAPLPIKTIAIFPKIQPDTACAVFLLREYGEQAFPGISRADVVFMTAVPPSKTAEDFEKEGTLLIDLGKSRFDHHTDAHGRRDQCASTLIAEALGLSQRPELRKLLQYVKRDDLEGKGTLSTDPLDRAFGLSGIISNMNRVHAENPQAVLDFVISVFATHVFEEYKRQVEMPAEWKTLKASGKGQEMVITTKAGQPLRIVALESDNVSLPGFLRAVTKADVIIQRRSTGHTNIITRQEAKLDLRELVATLRLEEASRKGVALEVDAETLRKPNHVPGVEEWFYDTAATTIQNGGIRPEGVTPTRIDFPTITLIVQRSF